ncbi:hypothetical protein VNI00_006477 [Paramarasmius palmivorus]|uniref:Uncharacterized protein n=1 Tax=Paramarasmius palmivorus TaxID=297713 RepID=A0AAW0D817_9AGAR
MSDPHPLSPSVVGSASQASDLPPLTNDLDYPTLPTTTDNTLSQLSIVADRGSPVPTEVTEVEIEEVNDYLCSSPTLTEPTPTTNTSPLLTTSLLSQTVNATEIDQCRQAAASPTPTEATDPGAPATPRALSRCSSVSTDLDYDNADADTFIDKLTSKGIKVIDYALIGRPPAAYQIFETIWAKDVMAQVQYLLDRPGKRGPIPGKMLARLIEIGWLTTKEESLLPKDFDELKRWYGICDKKKLEYQDAHPGSAGQWGVHGKGEKGPPYNVIWRESGPETRVASQGLPAAREKKVDGKGKQKAVQEPNPGQGTDSNEVNYPKQEDHLLGLNRPPSMEYRKWMASTASLFWPWLSAYAKGSGEGDQVKDKGNAPMPSTSTLGHQPTLRRALGRQATFTSLVPASEPSVPAASNERATTPDTEPMDVDATPPNSPKTSPSPSLIRTDFEHSGSSLHPSDAFVASPSSDSTTEEDPAAVRAETPSGSLKRRRNTPSPEDGSDAQTLRRSKRIKMTVHYHK